MRARFNAAGRPLRFLVVGAWNTLFGLVVFSVLYLLLGDSLGYLGVLTLATVVAVIQSHATQRLLVWRSRAPYLQELMRFSAVYVGTYMANLVLLTLAVDGFDLPVLTTQWAIGLALLVPVYLIQRVWAFRVEPVAHSGRG